MTVLKISKHHLGDKAVKFINGDKGIEPSFLLTAAFSASVLTKEEAAKVIGVQEKQVAKFTSPRHSMTNKAAKKLAEAIIAKM